MNPENKFKLYPAEKGSAIIFHQSSGHELLMITINFREISGSKVSATKAGIKFCFKVFVNATRMAEEIN